ncbi:PilN domain-containing protein [Psychrobacillus sp. FSL K6-2836]|uniref:PilN domain-containing protein n=1 Tax=Psychrobacillus sp. FSL K6-2836 TaxID=2921548 RepID=UPI0030FA02EA
MYIDINLLQKKTRKIEWFVVAIILTVVVLFVVFFLYSLHNQEKSVEQQLESNLENELLLQQTEQQNIASSISDKEQLKSLVEWAETRPVPTVFLLMHLSQSFPERGFIKLFTYTINNSSVSLTGQFESNAEAAHYLTTLKASPYVLDATIISLATNTELENTAVSDTQQFQLRVEAIYEIIIDIESLKQAADEEVPSS